MTEDRNEGRLLANRYRIIELVGKGAMGQVYRAEDTVLGGLTVAIKFVAQAVLNEKRRTRFEQEATICALLGEKSIHIVQVRDYGLDEYDVPFYAMEFLQGKGLNDLIKHRPLSLKRFLRLTRQICLGLQCAHQGIFFKGELCPIIHRDIKPSNILIVQDSTLGEMVKILDFGIAKLIQTGGDQTHSFQGTLAYCSPEQMEGKELDNRSNIYSLGVMMYEMITGEMPILPENNSFGAWYQAHRYYSPEPFRDDLNLPSSLQDLIYQCLAKKREQRPQGMDEVLEAFTSIEEEIEKSKSASDGLTTNSLDYASTYPTQTATGNDEHYYLNAAWPPDKPRQKIVFPRLINSAHGAFPSLWVMLDKEDIEKRLLSTRYNQFLFIMSPHPMVLWITALHNTECGTRWLPCYLDLKTSSGQRTARSLGELGYYRILFFALESADTCQHVLTSTIAGPQRQKLHDWAQSSQTWESHASPQMSKQLLRREFENIKPKIQFKLESLGTDAPSNVSGL
ncbi:serine/threonine protein kinase [Halothece sp. PCC 7418]|uniref:serine/threonine-protein kinase n=1 Tax=Halothece sp. (strain PCC 7418) TaxID=65093 RepID=UPI0002A0764C|nr:serine/threonine-protein kinase [Halothece sp. PCC 7418]AFZ42587.1 serine/threonine protein kinase [Halothece sp. PCC 7418]